MGKANDKSVRQPLVRTARILDLRVEARADGAESRTISGYAVRFNEWSKPFWGEWIEMIEPGAFDNCDMSDVIMCTDHGVDCADVLARRRDGQGSLTIEVDEQGVRFSFDAPNTTRGNDILEQVRRGDISECSFKFIVAEDRWVWRTAANGLEYDQRMISAIEKLFDLSIVVSGQYPNTSAVAERAAVEELRREASGGSDPSRQALAEIARERVALYEKMATI